MKTFSQEQLEALKQYEDNFKRAIESKYFRNMTSKALDNLAGIYDEVADKPLERNWSCNHCVLSTLQTIGKKYFDDYETLKNKAAHLVETLDEIFGDVPDIEVVPPEPEPKPIEKATVKKSTKKAAKK